MDGCVTTSDGVRLHVESRGEGPPILFVAGYTATAASWAFQADSVVAAGYRAVILDRRWHGESDRPAHGHRIARHAADVREVIGALDLERPLLVGASMGASVCWSCLDIFGCAAVRGMIGIDQTPKMVNADGWPFGFYVLDETNLGTFFAEGVPPTGRGRPLEASMAAAIALQQRVGEARLSDPITPDTRALLDDHARQDWRDVIAVADVPMLLIAGQDSQLWPADHAPAAVASSRRARAALIADCGHAANIDRPEAVSDLIITFARGI